MYLLWGILPPWQQIVLPFFLPGTHPLFSIGVELRSGAGFGVYPPKKISDADLYPPQYPFGREKYAPHLCPPPAPDRFPTFPPG